MSLIKKLGLVLGVSTLLGVPAGCQAEKMLKDANRENARHYGISEPYTPPLTIIAPAAIAGALTYKILRGYEGGNN